MPVESQLEPQAGPIARPQTNVGTVEERLSLMDVWRVLMKRRVVVLSTLIVVSTIAAIYTFRMTPVYENVSRIEINPNKGLANVGLENLIQDAQTGEDTTALHTQVLVLQSESVIFQTARNLDLVSNLRAARKGRKANEPVPTGEITPPERLALIGWIRGGLKVQIIPGTDMIEIHYRSTDPHLGSSIVNKLVDTYIDEDLRSRFDRTRHVSTWLEQQLEDLKREASDAQRQLADYQKQHNIVGSDESSNLTMVTLSQISSAFENAEADRIMKEARMREYEGKDSDLAALMGDNAQLTSLRSQLMDLKTQRTELATKYGTLHPRMREIDAQISKIQANIDHEVSLAKQQISGEYAGAVHLQDSLRKRLDQQMDDAFRLNENVAQYEILRHEAEVNRDLYDTLQMRLKESGVMAGLSGTDITIVDRATAPLAPIAPNKSLDLLLGLAGGVLLGGVLAFLLETIDDTLQTSEEVESVTMLAALATIPHILSEPEKRSRGGKEGTAVKPFGNQLASLRDTKSFAAEAYRNLRSSLLLSSVDNPPQVILMTSALPSEGKTTTAVNMAIALAQRGEKVLLVDGDLRRGTLDRVLNLEGKNFGLSTVLSQSSFSGEMLRPFTELSNFYALPTGPRPPNPAEMLSSHRMEERIRQWRTEYDRIVFDTAPLLSVSDTQAMATLVDSVILVARAGVTRKRALLRVRDILLRINAPIAGVVVNDVDLRLENFYTSRYGMYGYSYGYKYRYGRPYSDKAYGFEDEPEGK